MQKNGRKGFLGAIRHQNAYKDPHASAGRWMVRRYTIEQVGFSLVMTCSRLSFPLSGCWLGCCNAKRITYWHAHVMLPACPIYKMMTVMGKH